MKILLADDHGLFRDSMSVWLEQLSNPITFDFADSYQGTEGLLQSPHNYTLVMLDLGMPGMQGMLSIRLLCTLAKETPLLIVSADEDPSSIQLALEAGAAGYVTKSSPGETILEAAKHVISGGLYFPESIPPQEAPILEKFSTKQQQLLALLAEGKSNKELSEKLFLSEGTIKQYVSKIFRLLDVDNRTQAGIKAREILRINPTSLHNQK